MPHNPLRSPPHPDDGHDSQLSEKLDKYLSQPSCYGPPRNLSGEPVLIVGCDALQCNNISPSAPPKFLYIKKREEAAAPLESAEYAQQWWKVGLPRGAFEYEPQSGQEDADLCNSPGGSLSEGEFAGEDAPFLFASRAGGGVSPPPLMWESPSASERQRLRLRIESRHLLHQQQPPHDPGGSRKNANPWVAALLKSVISPGDASGDLSEGSFSSYTELKALAQSIYVVSNYMGKASAGMLCSDDAPWCGRLKSADTGGGHGPPDHGQAFSDAVLTLVLFIHVLQTRLVGDRSKMENASNWKASSSRCFQLLAATLCLERQTCAKDLLAYRNDPQLLNATFPPTIISHHSCSGCAGFQAGPPSSRSGTLTSEDAASRAAPRHHQSSKQQSKPSRVDTATLSPETPPPPPVEEQSQTGGSGRTRARISSGATMALQQSQRPGRYLMQRFARVLMEFRRELGSSPEGPAQLPSPRSPPPLLNLESSSANTMPQLTPKNISVRDCTAIYEIIERFVRNVFIIWSWVEDDIRVTSNSFVSVMRYYWNVLLSARGCMRRDSSAAAAAAASMGMGEMPTDGISRGVFSRHRLKKMAATANSLHISVPCINNSAVALSAVQMCPLCTRTDNSAVIRSQFGLQADPGRFETKVFNLLSLVDYSPGISGDLMGTLSKILLQALERFPFHERYVDSAVSQPLHSNHSSGSARTTAGQEFESWSSPSSLSTLRERDGGRPAAA